MARAQRLRILYSFGAIREYVCVYVVLLWLLRSRPPNGCTPSQTQKRIRNSGFESQNQHRTHAQHHVMIACESLTLAKMNIFVCICNLSHSGQWRGKVEWASGPSTHRRCAKSPRQFRPKNFCARTAFLACIRNYNQTFHFHQRSTGERVVWIFNFKNRQSLRMLEEKRSPKHHLSSEHTKWCHIILI